MTLPCHPFDIQYLICFFICSLFWYYCFSLSSEWLLIQTYGFHSYHSHLGRHICVFTPWWKAAWEQPHLCDSHFACAHSLTITQDTRQRRRPNHHKAGSCAPVLTSEQCLVWAHNRLAKLHFFVHSSDLNLTITQPNHHHNCDLISKGTGIGRAQGNGLRLQVARERARTWIRRWTAVS